MTEFWQLPLHFKVADGFFAILPEHNYKAEAWHKRSMSIRATPQSPKTVYYQEIMCIPPVTHLNLGACFYTKEKENSEMKKVEVESETSLM